MNTTGIKVRDKSIGLTGEILRIRFDDAGDEIFTIVLDDPKATPDGLLLARRFELEWL